MKYQNIREEELKIRIAQDYFPQFDCAKIIGNVDFCVSARESLLWAEAKKGSSDILKSLAQLILTIGKARTFDKSLPPTFLGAFDGEKISFIPYSDIYEIFYLNDFNWNVAPSNYETKEFRLVYEKVKTSVETKSLLFFYENNDSELKKFISQNFISGKHEVSKLRIDKNNFISVFNKWLQTVKPTIAVNWEKVNKGSILAGDFFLADLLSSENKTLREKLFVLLSHDHYELDRKLNELDLFTSSKTGFTDKQAAHQAFWNIYERPPKEEYWDYIVERRDLLVPQDIRERKGSFFTPQIWVELSQEYLAKTFGEDWQDEYYVWDCAAGTGNLLAGLTNKYHVWASTLDKQDVEVMQDRIDNGANLLEKHVFQFDFLNGNFADLPEELREIVFDADKRKKLIIYINPPYAEHTNRRNLVKTSFKDDFGKTLIRTRYENLLQKAKYELFAQFLVRVFKEIPGAKIGEFSKLKLLLSPNFVHFKQNFNVFLEKFFIVPAESFDNVKGLFPIGFKIWNTEKSASNENILADVYDKKGNLAGQKMIYMQNEMRYINEWIKQFAFKQSRHIGILNFRGNDFQHQSMVYLKIAGESSMTQLFINQQNLLPACIYFSVRHCISANWLNDRDQFLYPNEGWKNDTEFQNDCLIYTIFHTQNRVSFHDGINHWIPFSEKEVNPTEKFKSDFMYKFIKGKLKSEESGTFLEEDKMRTSPLIFSPDAQAALDTALELWKIYHKQPQINVNASLFDIKQFFKGAGKDGNDENYSRLTHLLREKMTELAQKIEKKVFEYRFLRR